MSCRVAGECLPAANDGIDVKGVDLDSVAPTASTFRRNERGTAAQKRIEDYVAPARGIEKGIRNQRHGLHGRMRGEERQSRVMVITEFDAVAPAAQVPAGTFCSSNP
jgi:hypothetical protein